MSTVMTWQTVSTSSDATEQLAEKLGQRLKGREVIELVSDLGGGKTTFVRGLARGTGSADKVSSPSFTITRVYKAGKLELHHFDFYRMDKPGLLTRELDEVMGKPDSVVVVEWADIVQHVLPAKRLTINIKNTDDDTRLLTFSYPKELLYLVEDL